MLFVDGHAGGKDNGFLSRADEDVAITRAAMEPIWIVEGATAEPEDVGKALHIKVQRRATSDAEVEGNSLAARA